MEALLATMAKRLYGDGKPGRELYTLEGVLVDETKYLESGMKLVLVREGEDAFLDKPPPPAAPDDEVDEYADGVRTVTTSFFVNNMKKVDAIEGLVEVDFQLYLSWIDPKLVGVEVKVPWKEPKSWSPKEEVRESEEPGARGACPATT